MKITDLIEIRYIIPRSTRIKQVDGSIGQYNLKIMNHNFLEILIEVVQLQLKIFFHTGSLTFSTRNS